jgi:hypothetical protein
MTPKPIKPVPHPADVVRVWWLIDFVIDAVIIDRIQRRRSRRREREFAVPYVARGWTPWASSSDAQVWRSVCSLTGPATYFASIRHTWPSSTSDPSICSPSTTNGLRGWSPSHASASATNRSSP